MNPYLILGIVVATLIVAFDAFLYFIHKRYKSFVFEHSTTFKSIIGINERYTFNEIKSFDMSGRYDNVHFYDDISPLDYLTYQLVYSKREVSDAIKDTEDNQEKFKKYQEDIRSVYRLGNYENVEKIPVFKKMLAHIEKTQVDLAIIKPKLTFSITVVLWRTNIKGYRLQYKGETFDSDTIQSIIKDLNRKDGDFYLNAEIWQSICRVERGKVSNKLRFQIYARDRYRCRNCGSPNDLEIDHIFPISKGGKSTVDNLQTLCHRCNSSKTNVILPGADRHSKKYQNYKEQCPMCFAPLVLRQGKYGKFYGCTNYPKCQFTKLP